MTYNVSGGTLNLTQLPQLLCSIWETRLNVSYFVHKLQNLFQSEGQRRRPCSGMGTARRGSPPPTTEVLAFWVRFTPGKFRKFYLQNGAFWGKIALCFNYKQTAILTQTFGRKCFSEVE